MKHRFLTLAILGAMTSTMFLSCRNVEEPVFTDHNQESDGIEYNIDVKIPEEFRTRGASESKISESGLLELEQRDINKLWYFVYYDGSLKTSGSKTSDTNGLSTFSISFSLTQKQMDPEKLKVFFWAGNNDDDIVFSGSDGKAHCVTLDYNSHSVKIDYRKMNGEGNGKIGSIYESFAGCFQLSNNLDKSDRNYTFTLKRPFAEIHILTDDFVTKSISNLKDNYSSGIFTYPALGQIDISKNNSNTRLTYGPSGDFVLPSSWDFLNNTVKYDGFYYDTNSFYMKNALSGESPERVTFKDREMDYLAYFFLLCPPDVTHMKWDNAWVPYDFKFLNLIFTNRGNMDLSYNTGEQVAIPLPADGFKANYKYVIYDKSPENGGEGFLTPKWNFSIEVNENGSWENPNTEFTE